MPDTTPDAPLHIGALIYPRLDQMDLTGPFEVFSRLPASTFHVVGKDVAPVRDMQGLLLTPERTLNDCPPLDVLIVPGGHGQEDLMDDHDVLSFLRTQASGARVLFSVCTGTLLCGAAGLLVGRRATTHWSALHLLPYFGAISSENRVVIDGPLITTAGVSAGIDGALRVASALRGPMIAQQIQLYMQYAPEPPFHSGTPASAPPEVLAAALDAASPITARRLVTARRIATRLGTAPAC